MAAALATARVQVCGRWATVLATNQCGAADAWLAAHVSAPAAAAAGRGQSVRIGFDTESKPVMYKPNQLALLQFAVHPAASAHSADIQVLLFSIHKLGPNAPVWLPHVPHLRALLEESRGTRLFAIDTSNDVRELGKIGVNVHADAMEDLQLHPRAKALVARPGLRAGSAVMAQQLLGLALPKHTALQRSDWSQYPLSATQVQYAAQDVVLALMLANELSGGPVNHAPAASSSSSVAVAASAQVHSVPAVSIARAPAQPSAAAAPAAPSQRRASASSSSRGHPFIRTDAFGPNKAMGMWARLSQERSPRRFVLATGTDVDLFVTTDLLQQLSLRPTDEVGQVCLGMETVLGRRFEPVRLKFQVETPAQEGSDSDDVALLSNRSVKLDVWALEEAWQQLQRGVPLAHIASARAVDFPPRIGCPAIFKKLKLKIFGAEDKAECQL